jgi:hypothetical protein
VRFGAFGLSRDILNVATTTEEVSNNDDEYLRFRKLNVCWKSV